jgi:hypothetical protein
VGVEDRREFFEFVEHCGPVPWWRTRALGSILCGVINAQDFDALVSDAIDDNIRVGEGTEALGFPPRVRYGHVAATVSTHGQPHTVCAWSAGGNGDDAL